MSLYQPNEKSQTAALERKIAWERAVAGQITTEELYHELGRLKDQYGEAVYTHDRLGRR